MGCGREGSVAMCQSDCAALYGVEWLRQVGESSDEVDVYRGMFTYFVICVELHVVELATDVLEIGGVAGCLRSSNISSGYVRSPEEAELTSRGNHVGKQHIVCVKVGIMWYISALSTRRLQHHQRSLEVGTHTNSSRACVLQVSTTPLEKALPNERLAEEQLNILFSPLLCRE